MSDQEITNDFTSLMLGEGVKPIKAEAKVSAREHLRRGDMQALEQRRREAEGVDERFRFTDNQLLNPLDPVEWKRDGVQEGVYRNLRLGKYTVDARLDLINRTLSEACEEVPNFVKECYRLGLRTVMITHGRGKHLQAPQNKMKSALTLWLPNIDEVLAFHSCQPQYGGLAAIYLLLRKNEEQRLANLERHR
ncbi:putative DNA endonuclease SmrA [Marinobacterium sp. xm-d-579]|uniref:DNA endonuclease SmrA n=1 Tax=Marinobacterium sp. xm-d-579 TaxID=2497734 RepID=UPI0019FD6886|nr:putative DNA endonuclease SmrA [Marinobacterium sp. xm-d-579]